MHCLVSCSDTLFNVSAVSAHVVGEDEAVMKAASAKDMVLKIWHSKDGPVSDKPPARVRHQLKLLLLQEPGLLVMTALLVCANTLTIFY